MHFRYQIKWEMWETIWHEIQCIFVSQSSGRCGRPFGMKFNAFSLPNQVGDVGDHLASNSMHFRSQIKWEMWEPVWHAIQCIFVTKSSGRCGRPFGMKFNAFSLPNQVEDVG